MFELLEEIKKVLEEEFQNPRYFSEIGGEHVKMNIHIGALPPELDDKDIFPYILIQPKKWKTDENETAIDIRFACSVYSDESLEYGENGEKLPSATLSELIAITSRCENVLIKTAVFEKKYIIDLPVTCFMAGQSDFDRESSIYYDLAIIEAAFKGPGIERQIKNKGELNDI